MLFLGQKTSSTTEPRSFDEKNESTKEMSCDRNSSPSSILDQKRHVPEEASQTHICVSACLGKLVGEVVVAIVFEGCPRHDFHQHVGPLDEDLSTFRTLESSLTGRGSLFRIPSRRGLHSLSWNGGQPPSDGETEREGHVVGCAHSSASKIGVASAHLFPGSLAPQRNRGMDAQAVLADLSDEVFISSFASLLLLLLLMSGSLLIVRHRKKKKVSCTYLGDVIVEDVVQNAVGLMFNKVDVQPMVLQSEWS